LNILIIENSEILNERYKRLLSNINRIKILMDTNLNSKTFKYIKNQKIKVLVIAQNIDIKKNIKYITLLKKYNPKTIVIILSTKPFPQINKKYKESGVDFILDKSTEFNKLPEVLQELKLEEAN
tara:strand:- start:1077 stop:1448 length:372 start_codon:yes stop_codon:yes gene_type:complete